MSTPFHRSTSNTDIKKITNRILSFIYISCGGGGWEVLVIVYIYLRKEYNSIQTGRKKRSNNRFFLILSSYISSFPNCLGGEVNLARQQDGGSVKHTQRIFSFLFTINYKPFQQHQIITKYKRDLAQFVMQSKL